MNSEFLRRSFTSDCYVPVRIIKTNDHELLDELVVTSNNQNKMSPRNLRSNSREQRVIQTMFNQMTPRWFYERKDGEFESNKRYQKRSFKIKDYQYDGKTTRVVSNEMIAKAWLSFIGRSIDASEKINAFDLDENNGKYEWLFKRRPKDDHWLAITYGPQVKLEQENFEPYSPTSEQYMVSYIVYSFIKDYLPSPQVNKAECYQRLEHSRQVNGSTSQEDITRMMMEDDEFVINQILYNMKEVLVELYSWILIKTYGPITPTRATEILSLSDFQQFCTNPSFKQIYTTTSESDVMGNVLRSCMAFIKEALYKWKILYGDEYLNSSRRIRYLHTAKFVEQMKAQLEKTNMDIRRTPYEWKPQNMCFLETLPKL